MSLALLIATLLLPLQTAPDAAEIIRRSAGDPAASAATTATDGAPDSETIATGQAVLATVNGEAITAGDLTLFVRQRAGPGAEVTPEMMQSLRRQVAEQILLSGEAELAGVELSDGDVERYWEDYVGQVPDFEGIAETMGSTVKRQRELARRAVLAEIFVYHKVGLWSDFAQVLKPDPLLQKLTDVTPGQMRQLFLSQPELFSMPASVAYLFYACEDVETAESVRQVLLSGAQPPNRRPVQEQVKLEEVPDVFGFSEGLVRFFQLAPVDSVSEVFEADLGERRGALVFLITARGEAAQPSFAEVQEQLRRYLTTSRVDVARRQLVATLVPQAFYWPAELFKDPTADTGALQGGR